MDKYTLIVNPSGRLSACPTPKDFSRGDFITEGMVVISVAMSIETRAKLWNNRDNTFIYAEGLPTAAIKPRNVYFQVRDGELVSEQGEAIQPV